MSERITAKMIEDQIATAQKMTNVLRKEIGLKPLVFVYYTSSTIHKMDINNNGSHSTILTGLTKRELYNLVYAYNQAFWAISYQSY